MDQKPRIVAVDVGTKRVGIAITDPLCLFAQPYGTYNPAEALKHLVHLSETYPIDCIVFGWPLMLDGREGKATLFVKEYMARAKKVLACIPFEKWDERFTSEMAKTAIKEAGRRKGRTGDKGRVDTAAAVILLQDYLER